jgi:GNAT superfamily N-acetyltransferase
MSTPHGKMPVDIAGPLLDQASLCVPILRLLPDWFGIEEALRAYGQEIGRLPTFLARTGGDLRGFLSLKQHYPHSAEILVMAVHPEAHRLGIGKALVEAAEAHARGQGIEYLQVKTLGPSRPDEHYARTRAFYQALGFRPLEETTRIWDEDNPCLILVKRM